MNDFLRSAMSGGFDEPLFEEEEEDLELRKQNSSDFAGNMPEPLDPPDPAQAVNGFQQGADEFEAEQQDAQNKQTLEFGLDKSADEIAEADRLAADLELPIDAVHADPVGAAKQSQSKQLKIFLDLSPKTQKIMQDMERTYGLAESIPEISWYESLSDTFTGWGEDLGLGLTKGEMMTEYGLLMKESKLETNPGAKAGMIEKAQKIKKDLAALPSTRNPIAGAGALESLGKVLPMMKEGFVSSLPVALEAAGVNALGFSPGGPAMMAIGGGGGFTAGMSAGMAKFMFDLEEGLAYDEYLDAGLTEEHADILSRGVGGVNALLELTGAGFVAKPFQKPLMRLITKEVATVLKDKTRYKAIMTGMKAFGASATGEISTEVLQQVSQISGLNLGQFLENKELQISTEEGRAQIVQELIHIFDETGKAMLFLALPGTGITVVSEFNAAKKADETEAAFKAMGTATPASIDKLNNKFQDAVNEVTKDGPVANVYIDVDKFDEVYQDQADAVAEELGVTEQLEEARKTEGGLLEVPVGTYGAKIGRDEEALAKIYPHSKFDPMDDTPSEAAKLRDPDKLAADFEKEMEGIQGEDEVRDSAKQVFEAERDQLEATGRYTKEQAEVNALLARNVFTTLSKKYNNPDGSQMLPHQMAERYGKFIDKIDKPLVITREDFNRQGLPTAQALKAMKADGVRIEAGKNKKGQKVGETNIALTRIEREEQVVEGQALNQQAEAVKRSPEFQEKFKDTEVVDDVGDPMMMFHGTKAGVNFTEFGQFSHFGTQSAADSRLGSVAPTAVSGEMAMTAAGIPRDKQSAYWRNLTEEQRDGMLAEHRSDNSINTRVIPVFLDIKNALEIEDDHSNGDLEDLVDQVVATGVISAEEGRGIKTKDALGEILKDNGYDGLKYRNQVEDPGSTSYVPIDSNQIKSIFNTNPTEDADFLNQEQEDAILKSLPTPEEIFGTTVEELNQEAKGKKKKKAKPPSRTEQTGSLDTIYPEINAALKEVIGRMTRPERTMFKKNMKLHAGTKWAAAAVRGMAIREMFFRTMEGRNVDDINHSGLWGKDRLDRYSVVKSFLTGDPNAVEQRAKGYTFMGDNRKAELDVSGSFKNCNPSKVCAQFCYAADANARPAELIKAEFTEWIAEKHPDVLADRLFNMFEATNQHADGLALRINDKGDLSPAQLILIKAMNAKGVRMQIFSKRPDMLRKVSDFNLKMLSIDESNFELARENPDLQLAVVIGQGMTQEQIAEVNDRVAVYLPVNQGKSSVSRADVKARFPDKFKEMTSKLCPVDGGKMKTKSKTSYVDIVSKKKGTEGLHTCGACDLLGMSGCFFGKNKSENVRKIISQINAANGPEEQLRSSVQKVIDKLDKDLQQAKKRGELNDDEYASLITALHEGKRNIRTDLGPSTPGQVDPKANGPVDGDATRGEEGGSDGRRSPGEAEQVNQDPLNTERGELNQDRVTPNWYYSKLAESFHALPENKTPDQRASGWKKLFQNLNAKSSEKEWTGIFEWLETQTKEYQVDELESALPERVERLAKFAPDHAQRAFHQERVDYLEREIAKAKAGKGPKLTRENISAFLENHGSIDIETVEIDNTTGVTRAEFDEKVADLTERFIDNDVHEALVDLARDGIRAEETFLSAYERIRDEKGESIRAAIANSPHIIQDANEAALEQLGPMGTNEEIGVDLEQYTLPGGKDKGNILLKFNQEHPKARMGSLVSGKVWAHANKMAGENNRELRAKGIVNIDGIGHLPGAVYGDILKGFGKLSSYDPEVGGTVLLPAKYEKWADYVAATPGAKGVLTKQEEKFFDENVAQISEVYKSSGSLVGSAPQFQSHVFPDHQNIVVWVRKQTRTVGGKKILLLDEIQSDLAAAIEGGETNARAPFTESKSAYVGLAVRKIITYAIENGFDRVEWATGSQQSERYPSLKELARVVRYNPETQELKIIKAGSPPGPNALVSMGVMDEKKLRTTIGREAAEKLLAEPIGEEGFHHLQTGDIELSNKGMTDFYDRLVPEVVSKIVKGITGEKLDIEIKEVDPAAYSGLNQPGFDMAPIKKAFEGDRVELALFQKKNGGKRGSLQFDPFDISGTPSIMTLLENADLTTYLHESGHFYFEVLRDLASQADAPKSIRDDMLTLLRFVGVDKDTKPLTLDTWNKMSIAERRVGHEKVADAFERYLFEGKAPSLELRALFRNIFKWFKDVYTSLAGKDVPISNEVRSVFDRLLATEEEIKAAQRHARSAPLFKDNDVVGMDPIAWDQYSQTADDNMEEAQERMLKEDGKNIRWLDRARGRIARQMQREENEKRKAVREEMTSKVSELPVYQLKQFLQIPQEKKEVREKNPKVVDPVTDSLFTAIAKLGGIDREEAALKWGVDPKGKYATGLGVGRPVLRKEGGKTIAEMEAALDELGYLERNHLEQYDPASLEQKFSEEDVGHKRYSIQNDVYDISEAYEDFIFAQGEYHPLDKNSEYGGKLSEQLLQEYFEGREQIWRELPLSGRYAMTAEKGGLAPELVAEQFGYDSVDLMIQDLLSAPSKRETVDSAVDNRMLELYGEIDSAEQRQNKVNAAVANEARTRQVHTELKALNRTTGNKNILASEAREQAEEIISKLTPNKIRPAKHYAAERKANGEAEAALSKGDLQGAADHKRVAVLQYHFAQAATKALEELDRTVRYFKQFDSKTTRNNIGREQLEQIDGRLEIYDLRKSVSVAERERREMLATWIENQEELGFSPDIDPRILQATVLKHYRDVPMDEIRGLKDAVQSMEIIGRNKQRNLIADQKKSQDEMVTEMVERMEETSKELNIDIETTQYKERVKSFGRSILAGHKKFSFHAKTFDGERDGGPSYQYLVRPLNERTDWATNRKADETKRLGEIYGRYSREEMVANNKKIHIEAIGKGLSKNGIIAVALNWGNLTNQERMMSSKENGGYGWTRQQIEGPGGILDNMELKDWLFVQDIWLYLDSFWDEIKAKEFRINGASVERVEALPVNTKFGQFTGGYYPLKYNGKLSFKTQKQETADLYDALKRGGIGRAMTKRGHVESRAKGDVDNPVRLDPQGVIIEHVNQVIQDLAFHEVLIDTNRLLNNARLTSRIATNYGTEVMTQLLKTVEDVAMGDVPAISIQEVVWNHLRIGSSIMAMGWNMSTASIQFLGLSQSMSRVDTKWVLKGMSRYFTGAENMEAGYKWIYENSPMMRNRALTINREINEIRNKVSQETIAGGKINDVSDTFFYFIAKAQVMVDVPTWIGAYTKAMEEGVDGRPVVDEAEAISLADQAVKESQSSGELMDQSGMQRGSPLWKLWTNFYSFFSSTYNNTAHAYNKTDFKNVRSIGLFAADMLLIYTLPTAMSLLIKDLWIRGECDGGGDLVCAAKKLGVDHISYLMGTMMFVRELGNAVQGFNGYDGPPGSRFFSVGNSLIQQAMQLDVDRGLIKSAIGTVGTVTHMPAVFVTRILDSYLDAMEGKNVRPLAPLFGQAKESK